MSIYIIFKLVFILLLFLKHPLSPQRSFQTRKLQHRTLEWLSPSYIPPFPPYFYAHVYTTKPHFIVLSWAFLPLRSQTESAMYSILKLLAIVATVATAWEIMGKKERINFKSHIFTPRAFCFVYCFPSVWTMVYIYIYRGREKKSDFIEDKYRKLYYCLIFLNSWFYSE